MKRILVPVEFSESSGNALRYAHHLADSLGMHLSLLHCYPVKEYSRPYHFGKKDYHSGIREMLKDFYKKHIKEGDRDVRFVAKSGSVLENITSLSSHFELVIVSSNKLNSKLKRWMGGRTSNIASLAQCPVIIIPCSGEYTSWNKIWHINRRDNETAIIGEYAERLKINPTLVEAKSLDQTSFKSTLWRSIVTYVKKPKEGLRQEVAAGSQIEKIDIIILVSHQKNSFQKFVNDEAIQVIFQFDIPVLIFQDHMAK